MKRDAEGSRIRVLLNYACQSPILDSTNFRAVLSSEEQNGFGMCTPVHVHASTHTHTHTCAYRS